jgi:predicted TIM-barrel fold metal-dependent hydrolase
MPRAFADYYREHFWLTTSGAFSNSALTCSIAEMGVERILFSIDWPFMSNRAGRKYAAPVSDHDRTLILGANARKLLKVS